MSVAQLVETQLLRERITELTEANDALERERDAMQARAERAKRVHIARDHAPAAQEARDE